ncbi:glycosyltransferase family 4 protein [Sanguibacter suaedae]|uniref:Glycosyltransferase family 4 protein n=1 Tax=Sanguibacter suaedae TaxID=2795737 RepID=A0A934M9M8_9MICO|nr:glycosyltransferase family 4 protein [Sanguibacter suaedae]MBI9114760.1 glycosyltransferase family 4 protein [Sanguibacter suaedae]
MNHPAQQASTATRPGGRRPRVAVLVYNDCHADTRVLKSAATLAHAGADVRIFAVARPAAGYPVGVQRLDSGVVLERLPLFELARALEPAARVYRVLAGRGAPAAVGVTEDPLRDATGGPADRQAAQVGPPARPAAPASLRTPTLADRVLRSRVAKVLLKPLGAVILHSYWRHARKAVTRWGPDIVHANDGNTLQPAMALGRTLGVPYVYDSHELWTQRNVAGPRPLATVVERRIETRGIRRADAVVTVSPSIARYLQDTYGLAETPTLVRNVPPAAQATSDPADGRLRALAGLAPHHKVIAYGGRITTNRGLEETIAALAALDDDVHLVVLGYGAPAYLAALEAHATGLGVRDRMHLVGKVPSAEVSAALADADASVVFVRPTCLSYLWSLPNKLFESIHGGLPVVAADLPDTRRIVEEHGVGEVFSSDDPQEMARTIARVVAHPERYRAAARLAAGELTWEREAERLLDVYRSALGPAWHGALDPLLDREDAA